jgi:hypothetical protein
VAVGDEASARNLKRYFKSGSGKAFAKKMHVTLEHDPEKRERFSEKIMLQQ